MRIVEVELLQPCSLVTRAIKLADLATRPNEVPSTKSRSQGAQSKIAIDALDVGIFAAAVRLDCQALSRSPPAAKASLRAKFSRLGVASHLRSCGDRSYRPRLGFMVLCRNGARAMKT